MTWLDKLERRFGFLGIPGLTRIVVGLPALVWGLVFLNPDFRFALDLNPARILHGEVWRLITYIFLPQTFSLWVILALWFLWFIGEGLERAWGAFRLFGFVVNGASYRMALVAAFANYLIFFGPEIIHEARHRTEVSARRKRFESDTRGEAEPLHKCVVCGATELTDPNLDFRVARDGEEYCMAHLPKAAGVVVDERPSG